VKDIEIGIIADVDAQAQTYSVKVGGNEIPNCLWAAGGLFAPMMGFKLRGTLPVSTRVAVAMTTPPIIIGTVPSDTPDGSAFKTRTTTGFSMEGAKWELDSNPQGTVPSDTAADDMFDGEFEFDNLTGSFMRFLTFMTSMGSGRAAVECHVLRDLVRILSVNYEHFSSVGDARIYHDGRLNVEFNGTTYDHERLGKLTKNEAKAEEAEGYVDLENHDPLDTGRWRWTGLVGFIGDLFNMWFTDPPETLGKMAEECLRSGKARAHVGSNGEILLQSVTEVVLERVVRIVVPIRLKHQEDPQGVLATEMDRLDRQFLRQWDTGGDKREHHTVWQIREYARWLNQYHTLARLHQMAALKQEWEIPSEEDTPEPKIGCGEQDREAANKGNLAYWKPAYATIRIMRDGGILCLDAYGNAFNSGAHGTDISSARHIRMTAAGDIVLKAGGSLFMSARRHVELIAHLGGLVAKGRTFLRWLCEKGTLSIKSDFDPDDEYSPDKGDPKAEVFGNLGVRIEATSAAVQLRSKLDTRLEVEEPESALWLAGGKINLLGKDAITIQGQKGLVMRFQEDALVVAANWKNTLTGSWTIAGAARISAGKCEFASIESRSITSYGTILGPKNFGAAEGESSCCMKPHTNHISALEDGAGEDFELPTVAELPELVTLPTDDSNFQWKLLDDAEYRWPTPEGPKGDIDQWFQPHAQQYLESEDPDGYETWSGATTELITAPRTAPGAGWPGRAAKWWKHNFSGDSLNVPTSSAPSSLNTQTALSNQTVVFNYLKR
jgi:hypothetical protein